MLSDWTLSDTSTETPIGPWPRWSSCSRHTSALAGPAHRLRTGVFLTVGVIVSLDLMFALVRGPVEASINNHCIAYDVNLWHGGTVVALYVLATCGSVLASDQPHIRAWERSTFLR